MRAGIKRRPGNTAQAVTTGKADYLLQVVSGDLNSYGEFVEQVLRVMPGVTSIHSSLALREIKSSSRLPVY